MEIFKQYQFNTDGEIENVIVRMKSKFMQIKILAHKRIPQSEIKKVEDALAKAYQLNDVVIEQQVKENHYEAFKKQREQETVVFSSEESKKGPVIMGKKIKGKTVNMNEITDLSDNVVIEGVIFSLEQKEIWGGRQLFTFDMYDQSGAISCKIIADSKQAEALVGKLKKGVCLRLKGGAQYDKYARETIFMPNDIEEGTPIEKRKDSAEEKRIELHLHTQMSSMDAISSAKKLVTRAMDWGHKAVAITDHGVVQAFPEAFQTARGNKEFKVIYGVECYLVNDFDSPEEMKSQRYYHACILAQTQAGLKNLYKIITESHLNYYYKRPRVPKKLLIENREGLLLGSACEIGEVFDAIINQKPQDEIEKIAAFYDYLEIMPTGNNQFLIDNGKVNSKKDLQNINKKILALGEQLNKPVVATGDVHFMEKEDSIHRAIIQGGQGYKDVDKQAPLYFMTTDEMLNEFSYLGEELAKRVVIDNPNMIADSIEQIIPIPDGTYPPEMEGAEEQIKEMCIAKATRIYGENLPEIVQARMDKELEKIIKYGFSVMYLIAQKLVSKSLSDGYVVGSRGSVGSSFIAFLCGITEVNALPPHYVCKKCKHSEFILDGSEGCGIDMDDKICPECGEKYKKDGFDIPFETFLGFEGDKEPDIDLNFSGDYQGVAHKYVEELFGKGYVFKAGTIGTLADRTAYGFVKKYLDERGRTVHNAEINRLVQGCVGVKRTTGQHPGGLMILPKGHDIHEFCPVQYPADDKSKNVITTHFDYHSISGRLLKLDILGHDNPTIMRMLQDLTGIDPSDVPLDDQETLSIFTSTEALGVTPDQIGSEVGSFGIPEFGTRFVRNMLVETEPSTLSELVRISGLSHGTDVWTNNAQELVRNGTASLKEVICTRDDIMLYLMYQGLPPKNSFDIMERVRKGKKLTPDDEKLMRENKIPEWYIESCNKILYMFPKAHAAAYVTMAVIIAYFKVHHPEAFYISYFSVRADEFDISLMKEPATVNSEIARMEAAENSLNAKDKNVLTILQVVREMFARGLRFTDVDLYRSDAKKFLPTDEGILPPLMAVGGLGESVALSIVEERQREKFHSIEDLRKRTKLNKTVAEVMKQSGCLEGMTDTSQLSFMDL